MVAILVVVIAICTRDNLNKHLSDFLLFRLAGWHYLVVTMMKEC